MKESCTPQRTGKSSLHTNLSQVSIACCQKHAAEANTVGLGPLGRGVNRNENGLEAGCVTWKQSLYPCCPAGPTLTQRGARGALVQQKLGREVAITKTAPNCSRKSRSAHCDLLQKPLKGCRCECCEARGHVIRGVLAGCCILLHPKGWVCNCAC